MTFDKITVHCSATANGKYVSKETIAEWHKDRGFDEIGYHFLIEPDGTIVEGRSIDKMGAHVEGANTANIGVCVIGLNKFSRDQLNALLMLVKQLSQKYNIKPWEVYTHSQFPSAIKQGKTCPNISINKLAYYLATGKIEAVSDNLYKG